MASHYHSLAQYQIYLNFPSGRTGLWYHHLRVRKIWVSALKSVANSGPEIESNGNEIPPPRLSEKNVIIFSCCPVVLSNRWNKLYKIIPKGVWRRCGTERRGRVVNTHNSYSGGGFDSRPRRPAILPDDFRGLPQSLQANVGVIPWN
jgi:hypothetical protein